MRQKLCDKKKKLLIETESGDQITFIKNFPLFQGKFLKGEHAVKEGEERVFLRKGRRKLNTTIFE